MFIRKTVDLRLQEIRGLTVLEESILHSLILMINLDGQCVSKILNWITLGGADICFMRAMKVFPDGKQQLLDDEMNAAELKGSKESAIKYLSERSKYPGSPCTKPFSSRTAGEKSSQIPG